MTVKPVLFHVTETIKNVRDTGTVNGITTNATAKHLEPKPASDNNEPQLSQMLIITDNVLGDSRLPFRSSVTDGIATKVVSSGTIKCELNDWYPVVTFHFNDPSGIGLVNLKHVIVGPVKSYDSPGNI